jgi:hypothetical protein
MDSMELKHEKGITIQSMAMFCDWNTKSPTMCKQEKYAVNIIDMPGAFLSPCSLCLLMGLLSIDLPALLTALSMLPFQSMGVTTSTVSAGSIMCTRLLILIDRCHSHGVVCTIEILAEDSTGGGAHSLCKHHVSRRNHTCKENVRDAVMSLAPACTIAMLSMSLNMITVMVHELGTPLLMQMCSLPFWKGLPGAASALALGVVADDAMMRQ